ncbi:hypothetical protein, partial [Mycobacteroides abscessus]|uniref:hypothetical protein n=1 Tax=Mycobacteroides abscessus TaxID=36809 RepID=UPI000B2D4163
LLEPGWSPTDEPRTDDATDADADTPTDDAVARGTNGVSALTDDTTVTVLGSPMPVHAQRSC